ncbi:alpha/beta hydrolase [Streptomyces sp. NBC_00825]|uniref:alpha/beta hydrolase n=1 Tax=unclassified Streptomyces TaxID=2593676 RepID=UPI002ED291D6|nr:alpha/beta hydrolase [Streptomyces sp. NBC_00826]WTH88608.1 alpha/beta hydrolase [Streptomyces sp. NBC_00825]WTH97338.1 alpha/beta hydrolase [Streptomyces sp. NBC_00822]
MSDSSITDRIDPQVRQGLKALHELTGPGGLVDFDIPRQRELYEEMNRAALAALPPNDRVEYEDLTVPGPADGPDVAVRVYRPAGSEGAGLLPGILYIHGGGMITGSIRTDHRQVLPLVEAVDAVVVSVEYRLAPEHPHPAPVEDCYAALLWMSGRASELGIDPDRLALYGGSAGGGLAAGVALLARDRGTPRLAFQMLPYPMLDDRNITPSSQEITDIGIWDRAANLQGWQALLGERAGTGRVDPYAAPARADDLSGLPPAYLDVGELDLFRDENIAYANRLMQAGVPVELHVYPGGIHAGELLARDAELSTRINGYRVDALDRALNTRPAPGTHP